MYFYYEIISLCDFFVTTKLIDFVCFITRETKKKEPLEAL
jgi:hypothetical protein